MTKREHIQRIWDNQYPTLRSKPGKSRVTTDGLIITLDPRLLEVMPAGNGSRHANITACFGHGYMT